MDEVAPILMAVVGKFPQAERVGRKQTVGAGMPVSRMAEIFRMVEHRDINFFSFNFAIKIYPIGALAPKCLLASGSL